ncbi:hypothetical protein SAMN02787108_03233 [Lysinibacillus fusiformis]|nr:hypothetical protein SAMN02787108_03233 [Lysinibacillus fusiformis]SDB46115.1 hypothetical protein SAMN02787070_03428 [Lysinibacillus fusiformis]SFI72396.1 hypothetical protein SAMN02787080_03447 [Lysinibacillus fusiformis]SFT15443.1 hypothetical protein SAMN02787099_03148 [Lysinibacillus fusiformis]
MNIFPSKDKDLLKIYIKSYTILMLLVCSAFGAYLLKQSNKNIAFYIVFIFGLVCLHTFINRSMVFLIRSNQIKKTLITREAPYQELTKKEHLLNSVFLAPITIIISVAIYNTYNLILQIIMFFIILLFLLIGETAKFRYTLYKNWYDKNLKQQLDVKESVE